MESLEIVIKVRRIDLAVVASLILHALFFLLVPVRQHVVDTEGGSTEPLTVRLVEREPAAEAAIPEPPPTPVPPPVASRPAIMTRLAPHGPLKAPETVVPPQPQAEPTPPRPPEPPVDMMAAVNARREARRAAEAAAARGAPEPTGDDIARARIARNLKGPGEGVGGVFQILSKGTRTAEFAFNGWRPDTDRRWREVIEVDAGLGGDVDRAIVKRMIELIRTHYQGDFKWESHNLGRTVTLSARLEDNEGLEDFLVREFFGTPMVNSRR